MLNSGTPRLLVRSTSPRLRKNLRDQKLIQPEAMGAPETNFFEYVLLEIYGLSVGTGPGGNLYFERHWQFEEFVSLTDFLTYSRVTQMHPWSNCHPCCFIVSYQKLHGGSSAED